MRPWPSGVRSIATSTRWSRTPVTRPAQSPSIRMRPSSSRPRATKNAIAASRSATTMPMLSSRRTVTGILCGCGWSKGVAGNGARSVSDSAPTPADRKEQRMAHARFEAWALAALLLPSVAIAQPAIPDTPAGDVFGEWLVSFNAADADRIAAFQRTYERETPVADVLESRRETGGY